MKKLISLLIIVVLLFTTFFTSGLASQFDGGRNRKLDDAFNQNALRLTRAELPEITFEAFEFPDDPLEAENMGIPADLVSEIMNSFMSSFYFFSLSPTGNSGIVNAENAAIAWYNGKYHVLYPDYNQSVADEYSTLAKYMIYLQHGLDQFVSEEGIVYSPDGRYATIRNYVTRSSFGDPIVIDLSTGCVILTETYGSIKGGVRAACFSNDGQYLYYMIFSYNNTTDHKFALYRYDIQRKTTEFCFSKYDEGGIPLLSETANGSLIFVNYPEGRIDGVVSLTQKNGAWFDELYSCGIESGFWSNEELIYSKHSGYGITIGSSPVLYGLSSLGLRIFRPDEDFTNFDRIIAVPNDSNQVLIFTEDEWKDTIQNASKFHLPFQEIDRCRLSPDGYYALLLTYEESHEQGNWIYQHHLYLLRLEDLELREVGGIDPNTIDIFEGVHDRSTHYHPHIEWNCDTLFIVTEDGIEAYTFE